MTVLKNFDNDHIMKYIFCSFDCFQTFLRMLFLSVNLFKMQPNSFKKQKHKNIKYFIDNNVLKNMQLIGVKIGQKNICIQVTTQPFETVWILLNTDSTALHSTTAL